VDVEREAIAFGKGLGSVIRFTQDLLIVEDHDGQVLLPVADKREIGPGESVLLNQAAEEVVYAPSRELDLLFAVPTHPVHELLEPEELDLDFHVALSLPNAGGNGVLE
jgi:hypothetical protein